jgi:predicted DNA-binding protein (MmcQ/YjbR family)
MPSPLPSDSMQTVADLRAACAELSGSQETFPFGPTTLVFKVAGKMYALTDISADPLSLALKCDPSRAEALRAEYPGIVPGYHLNKRHWNTLKLAEVPPRLTAELLRHSYDLVVGGLTRAQRHTLGG